MKLKSGAEFDEGCEEFEEYEMVFVAVEACVVAKVTTLLKSRIE